jgi:hypothetical protein
MNKLTSGMLITIVKNNSKRYADISNIWCYYAPATTEHYSDRIMANLGLQVKRGFIATVHFFK